jgi:tetratricopeptide (TPR) repeat protein/transcriptional regulator with XRE-family HTH domain
VSERSSGEAGSLGVTLARQRMLAGLTQEELAAASGVSVRTISDLERGRVRRPRRHSLELLAVAFGLDQTQTGEIMAIARPAPSRVPPTDHAAAGVVPAVAAVPAAAGARLPPRMLPAAPRYFTGRVAEFAELDRWLGEAQGPGGTMAISVIRGTAGVGKSALALSWAHRTAKHFPDGQLYVNLQGFDPAGRPAMTAAETLADLLAALGVPPSEVPATAQAQAGLYRSLLADRRMLIVLDNARDAAQVRPLIPASPGCLLLVTSRDQLTGLAVTDDAQLLGLDVLTVADARSLLGSLLGSSRVAAEPGAADDLISMCARLPLALAVAAAQARRAPGLKLTELAGQLRAARLDVLDGGDPFSSLSAVFGCSYRQLPADAARMFRLLGLHPGPDISEGAAASLAGVQIRPAQRLLRQLAEANLITGHSPGRYVVHDLIREYAAELARARATPAWREKALRRLLDHYLHSAYAALQQIMTRMFPAEPPDPQAWVEKFGGVEQGQAWFAAEKQAILAAAAAADGAFPGHAWRMAVVTGTLLSRSGDPWQAIEILSSALRPAEASDGPLGRAHVRLRLGRAHIGTGSFARAREMLTQALSDFVLLGDEAGQATACQLLSLAAERAGDLAEALIHSERACALFRSADERRGEAGTLNAIGWLHLRTGDYHRGLAYCQQALEVNISLGFRPAEAETWDSIGYAHHQLGQYDQALSCYAEALRLHRQVGSTYYAADTLVHIGNSLEAAGDISGAHHVWRKVLPELDKLRHPEADRVRAKLDGSPESLTAGRWRTPSPRGQAVRRWGHDRPPGTVRAGGLGPIAWRTLDACPAHRTS